MNGKGADAEQAACTYLQRQGLKLLARNYHCRRGEIDIVVQDRDCLVFVEVRQRAQSSLVSAAQSVSASKQMRLKAAALHFVMTHPAFNEAPMRFDLITFDGDATQWHQNVLQWDSYGH